MKIFCLLSLLVLTCATGQKPVSVKTNVGIIEGILHEVDVFGETQEVTNYLGIPYAEPPVGERRFRKPVAKASFTSPFLATKHGNVCYGIDYLPHPLQRSEDCLFLNIYVPRRKNNSKEDPRELAVMVWIHGGGFLTGSSDLYSSDILSAFGNVIIVTFNYRLAAFGFLSTEDASSPGNYGLWDQHLAIQWVHDNIEAFGGDPGKVTVFGESAGAASAVYQSLYAGNEGLFQRTIAQSGSITSPWANSRSSLAVAQDLGRLLGCNVSDTAMLTECMRYMTAEHVNYTLNHLPVDMMKYPAGIVPSIDGEFVQEPVWDVLNSASDSSEKGRQFFSSLDLLVGMNSMEGAMFVNPMIGIQDPENFEPSRALFEDTLIPSFLEASFNYGISDSLKKAIISEYTNDETPEDPKSIRHKFMSFASDVTFTIPTINTVSLHARMSKRKTYLYNLDAAPSHHILPTPTWVDKATHGDDLFFVFGFAKSMLEMLNFLHPEGTGYDVQEWEITLTKLVMTAWTNFAKTGDPNTPNSLDPFMAGPWVPYNLDTQCYLNLTPAMEYRKTEERMYSRAADFWLEQTIPQLLRDEKETEANILHYEAETCERESDCQP